MKILIVEDEPGLAHDMADCLEKAHFSCAVAGTFGDALEKIALYTYDCVLLDLMLPGGNGLDLLKALQQQAPDQGVIILSAKNSLEDKIAGLQTGADDYLAKPFFLPELLARVHAVIRRRRFQQPGAVREGSLAIDVPGRQAWVNETPIVLTRKEFDLLLFLIGNKNRVVSKSAVAEHLSGDMADMLDSHDFVYTHVKNLKKKLHEAGCPPFIKTLYASGYKWETTADGS